jgi:hypothetical protein
MPAAGRPCTTARDTLPPVRRSAASLLLLLRVFLTLPLTAQSPAGAISGQVSDATGAVLPGAQVTAHRDAAPPRHAITDAKGRFRLSGLEPGRWTLAIAHEGFAPTSQQVDVRVAGEMDVHVALPLAGFATAITLQTDSDGIEGRRADLSDVIDREALEQLPVPGRNFVDVAKLQSQIAPGRENVGGGAFKEPDSALGPAAAPRLSFNGQSELHTSVLVDGLEATQTFTGLPRATSSQEAVEEFRVLSAAFGAEYGRALGGVVNIVTRSGGDAWRGTALYTGTHDALAAPSALSSGHDELHHQQFGGTLGGPIHDAGWTLFASYEGQRRRESNRFSRVILDNIVMLNSVRAGVGLTPETLDQRRTTDYDQGLIRIDRRAGTWQASARVTRLAAAGTNIPGGGGRASPASTAARDSRTRDDVAIGTVSKVLSSSMFLDVRGQWADRRFDFPSVLHEPTLEISNLIIMGKTTSDMDFYRERRGQISGTWELSQGRHLIKAGAMGTWLRDRSRWELFFPARIIFPTLSALSTFTPAVFWWPYLTTVDAPHPGNDPTWSTAVPAAWQDETAFGLSHAAAGAFVQDQWRLGDRLTATLGVRYDVEGYPSRYVAPDRNNLQPRLGVAWVVDPHTVLRGGYGLYFDRLAPSVGQMFNTTEWNSRGALPGAASLFPGVAPVLGRFSPLTIRGAPARSAALVFLTTGQVPPVSTATPSLADNLDSRMRAPYSQHFSVQVERRLAGLVATLSGVSVDARALPAHTPNINAVATATLPSGKPRLAGRAIPSLGDFFVQTNIGTSRHAAVTMDVRRRTHGGIGAGTSYTFGKTMSNADSLANVADFPAGSDIGLEHARSRQHVAQRLTAHVTDVTPIPFGALHALQLGAVLTADSGRPFTVFAGSDVNGDGNPNSDRAGLLGRGTLNGPAYASLDLRASWTLRWRGRRLGVLRADVFNALDRVNVRDLNTVWGSDDLSRTPDPQLRFGTPRDVFNPRQAEVGVRLQF